MTNLVQNTGFDCTNHVPTGFLMATTSTSRNIVDFFRQNTTLDIPFYRLEREGDLNHHYAETAWKLSSQLGLNNLVLLSDNMMAVHYFRQMAIRQKRCVLETVFINSEG